MLTVEGIFNLIIYGIVLRTLFQWVIKRSVGYVKDQIDNQDNNPRHHAIYNHFKEKASGNGHDTEKVTDCVQDYCVALHA